MDVMNRKAWGEKMEEMVTTWLAGKGYVIVARNYRCRYGEIDIVAIEGGCLVLVEVKARRSMLFGRPMDAVNNRKLEKIARSGEWLRQEYGGYLPEAVRIDVVEVLEMEGKVQIEVVRGVGSF